MSKYNTKTTKVGNYYICQVSYNGKPVVQTKVTTRTEIGPAFRDLMRTLDKMGGDEYTHAARYRQWNDANIKNWGHFKHEWL